ncbi:hypothetical protein PR202_gb11861 [Eleusine coracana subsp. coracana]|uniref:Uncharacterized protein n=1 Tax=Eleusine coracana subsp. coracana TaxID=191504 RepID=A0AAV5ENM7_ELECO|nr:hypothetical protein PR202_gb11861 [Eleusine coracana subsp. coracana]
MARVRKLPWPPAIRLYAAQPPSLVNLGHELPNTTTTIGGPAIHEHGKKSMTMVGRRGRFMRKDRGRP